ncbi:hypothetical protein EV175_002801 [Coemansia sp. RSA 1933]|nr:hypothetical protein EV175_002801 [Coemansia sp. RSA 1933]
MNAAIKRFTDSIESQAIPLSVVDTQGSFSNIPFVFFYKNTNNSADFMPKDVLHRSFYRAMEHCPFLAGRIEGRGRGNVRIVVDKDDINIPDYTEDTSDVHFSELKAAGFAWHAWPQGVATTGPGPRADKNGEIKLINVHVVRLKDNSGVIIYVSIPHYAVDGEAHMEVIRRWCAICQLMVNGDEESIDKLPAFAFDRSCLLANLPKERTPMDSITEKVFTTPTIMSEWLAWVSPQTRGFIQGTIVKRQKARTHLFRVSQASFESLKSMLGEHLPNDHDITINQVLLAITTKTLAQAHRSVANEESKGWFNLDIFKSKEGTLPIGVVFETRKQLGLASGGYIGNVLMPNIVYKPLSEMEATTTTESLAKTIAGFDELVGSISAPLVASYIDMVTPRPSSFTRPAMSFSFHKTAMTFIYDVMPDMYAADFGFGRPAWVSPNEPFRANAVLLLTGKDPKDGIDVFMSTFPEAMDKVLKNEFWMSFAKKIY